MSDEGHLPDWPPEETVRERIRFLVRYSKSVSREVADQIDRSETERQRDYVLLSDQATALKEAGQWSLLLGDRRGEEYLLASAQLYLRQFPAFASFLGTIVRPGVHTETISALVGRMDPRLEASTGDLRNGLLEPHSERTTNKLSEITASQQAYALMAAVGDERILDRMQDSLRRIIAIEAFRTGVIPVGPLNTPLHRFWACAEAIVTSHLRTRSAVGVNVLSAHILAMCRQYEQNIELAQANSWTWQLCASPVDVVDLDIAGLVAIAGRAFGESTLARALAASIDVTSMAGRQIQIGNRLARNF